VTSFSGGELRAPVGLDAASVGNSLNGRASSPTNRERGWYGVGGSSKTRAHLRYPFAPDLLSPNTQGRHRHADQDTRVFKKRWVSPIFGI
jgi:hypothetical protein